MSQAAQGNEMAQGFWDFVGNQLGQEGGIYVLLLFGVLFLFWRLIWKVWSTALKAKDDEIDRIAAERDKYQKLVFKKLLSSVDDDNTDEDR